MNWGSELCERQGEICSSQASAVHRPWGRSSAVGAKNHRKATINVETSRRWNQRSSQGFITQGLVDRGWDFGLANGKHLEFKRFPPQILMIRLRKIIKTTCLEIVENGDIKKRTHRNESKCMLERWDCRIFFFAKNRSVIAALLLEHAFLKKAYHLRDRAVLLIVLSAQSCTQCVSGIYRCLWTRGAEPLDTGYIFSL